MELFNQDKLNLFRSRQKEYERVLEQENFYRITREELEKELGRLSFEILKEIVKNE